MTRFVLTFAVVIFAAKAQSSFREPAAPGGTSYFLLDANQRTVLALDWRDAAAAVPVGSLVKPFIAITYGQRHRMRFPVHDCSGGDCWLKTGHGRIGLVEAIAYSCNSYFLQLAGDVPPAGVSEVVERFGMHGPPPDSGRDTLFGIGSAWRLTPFEVARAYAELAARRTEPGIAEVVAGMRLAANIGTAAALGPALHGAPALAKTGTAPCSHSPKAAADGYTVVVYPGDSPRYVLLVQVHGVVGREAAETAARLLPIAVGER